MHNSLVCYSLSVLQARLGGGHVAADLRTAAPVDETHAGALGVGEAAPVVAHRREEEEGAHLLGAGAGVWGWGLGLGPGAGAGAGAVKVGVRVWVSVERRVGARFGARLG